MTSPASRRTVVILAALVAAGLAARLVNAGSGLWFDEIVTLVKYVRAPVSHLLLSSTDLNNHMLFTLGAKVTVGVFGEAPWALRLPAILFGVASIPVLWWFCRRLTTSREALLAALLLTVAYHHVWFSQNARGYTGLLLFNLLATGFFVDGLRNPRPRTWVFYGIAGAAALWTHLTGAFAIAAHGLVYVAVAIARRRLAVWPCVGFALAAVLGAALYAGVIPQMISEFGKQAGLDSVNVKVREWTSPWWTIREAIRQSGLGPFGLSAVAGGAILALLGFGSIARKNPSAAAAMVLPAPIGLAIVMALGFHVWPRYFFPLSGFAIVFFVRGVFVASEALAGRHAQRVAIGVVILAALGAASMLPATWKLPKQDYEGARDFVATQRSFGEPVVTTGLAAIAYGWLYAPDWTAVDDVAALDRVVALAPKTWLVTSFPKVLATSHPAIVERMASRFELVREFRGTVGDGAVSVYRSR